MLNVFWWIFVFSSLDYNEVYGSDQVLVPTFERVLRDSGKQWIIELTYNFNDQESIKDSRKVTMDAISENWKPTMLVPFCAGDENREEVVMNPLETVKRNAERFINYREGLKIYVEKLLEISISDNVFDVSEIEKMRELFWEVELRDQTMFEPMRKLFFKRIRETYSEGVAQEIEKISKDVIKSDEFLSINLTTRIIE